MKRCANLLKMPGTQGEWVQCINPATREEWMAGCPCKEKDPEVCEPGAWIALCAGPCNFGA